jgi:hypothetical protein
MSDTHPSQIARRDHWRNPGREDTKHAEYMTPVDERKRVIYARARAEGKTLDEAIDLAGYDEADAAYAKARDEGHTHAEAWKWATTVRELFRKVEKAYHEADRLRFGENQTYEDAYATAFREVREGMADVERWDAFIGTRVAEAEAMEEGCPELAAYFRAYYALTEEDRRNWHWNKNNRPDYEPPLPWPEEAVAAWVKKEEEAAAEGEAVTDGSGEPVTTEEAI